ncbi:DUF6046 domain-containing protein [Mucilaginibacter kameinonensis]|uniref:DUF6046 domain-containing protein n=1 Tax=Mucilaginibacter kameinonensis TaxID=452286 RepID=UPI000EF7BFBE|nr:DUF6046 domain-containing protein [Mucilaginibacter kameinonensis]
MSPSYANLNTVFDIADIFKQLYGYKPAHVPGFPPSPVEGDLANIQPATRKTTNIYGTPLYGQSDMIGREVFSPITIEVDGVDYYFPFAVIGFDRELTVKEVEMSELGGTAKQIVNKKDWVITIKGFLIGDYEQFPDEKLKMLNDVFDFAKPVRLKSAVSDIFLHSNDQVLIYKLSIPEKPKVIGVRDFALQIKSDSIFTLYYQPE